MNAARLNRDYLKILRQIPLMLRLRLDRRHGGVPRDVRRMLIVNNTLVGEFVVSLPAIRHLLDASRAEADLVVSPPVAPLARRMRGIGDVFVARSVYERETEAGEDPAVTPSGEYDLALVLQLSRASFDLLKRVRYRRIKVSLGAYLRYTAYVARRPGQKTGLKQIEDLMFDVVEQPRARAVGFDDLFQLERGDLERVARLPFLRDGEVRRIVVHTGSGWFAKLWSTERWAELVRAIGRRGRFQFVFVGGSEREERDHAAIRDRVPFEVHSVVRQADLLDVALIMRESDFFLGVDSGPRHVAHLLRLPSVCLLGPGPRMYSPVDRGAAYVDESDCWCSTLFCHRRRPCMDRIGVVQALRAFEAIDRANPGPRPRALATEGALP